MLNNKGHGKPVDLWSIGYAARQSLMNAADIDSLLASIITYVLLCGYAPFRSDDMKELVRQTTEAKITFHDRYWNNVSDEGAYSPQFLL